MIDKKRTEFEHFFRRQNSDTQNIISNHSKIKNAVSKEKITVEGKLNNSKNEKSRNSLKRSTTDLKKKLSKSLTNKQPYLKIFTSPNFDTDLVSAELKNRVSVFHEKFKNFLFSLNHVNPNVKSTKISSKPTRSSSKND